MWFDFQQNLHWTSHPVCPGIRWVALATTRAEWSGSCHARGRPIIWRWLGGSSPGLGRRTMLQTRRMRWTACRTCNRRYLTWTHGSSLWMTIITTRLVELVLNRPTTVHSLRSEILSQLTLYYCFLCCCCVSNMQIWFSSSQGITAKWLTCSLEEIWSWKYL